MQEFNNPLHHPSSLIFFFYMHLSRNMQRRIECDIILVIILCERRVFISCKLSCLMPQFHPSVIRSNRAQRIVAILLSRKNFEMTSVAMRTVSRYVTIVFNVHTAFRRRKLCAPLITA